MTVKKNRGRPKQWLEAMHVKLPAGSLHAIAGILERGETRAAFVRNAIAQAVRRRKKRTTTR